MEQQLALEATYIWSNIARRRFTPQHVKKCKHCEAITTHLEVGYRRTMMCYCYLQCRYCGNINYVWDADSGRVESTFS